MIGCSAEVAGVTRVAIGLTPPNVEAIYRHGAVEVLLANCGVEGLLGDQKLAIVLETPQWRHSSSDQLQIAAMARGYRYMIVMSMERLQRIATGAIGFKIEPETKSPERVEFIIYGAKLGTRSEARLALAGAGFERMQDFRTGETE